MASQGLYWIGTIPISTGWVPPTSAEQLPDGCCWIRGQRETGEGGLDHFQVCIALSRKQRLSWVTARFKGHWELTRSSAARDYVWKEETRVDGSQFEYGSLAIRRNVSTDWELVRANAVLGNFDDIPADVFVRCYNSLCRIRTDNLSPVAVERACKVFWGATGTGKSRLAWEEATLQAYMIRAELMAMLQLA
ncbi:MAG: putative viral replication protein [Cressdnaviricota sp.]|nr:MAG: putative viral replication protein [Cressdnaviricota sp.]